MVIPDFDVKASKSDRDEGVKGSNDCHQPAAWHVGLRLARKVAASNDWHDGWLNDDVKQFLSLKETKHSWQPAGLKAPNLRLTKPTANYLLAMKAVALSSRRSPPGHGGDEQDVDFLIRKMEVHSVEHIQRIVYKYFPDTPPSDLATAIIENIINTVKKERATHANETP